MEHLLAKSYKMTTGKVDNVNTNSLKIKRHYCSDAILYFLEEGKIIISIDEAGLECANPHRKHWTDIGR